MRKIVFLGLCSIAASVPFTLCGQDAPAATKASPFVSTVGTITTISAADNKMTVKTDAGAAIVIPLNEKTKFYKIAPGEKDLKKATESAVGELKAGDRVSARNRKMDDGSFGPATNIIVMTKEELAKQNEKTQEEWNKNGLMGTVSVVNAATKEVSIKLIGTDPKTVVIEPADKVNVRRYAETSVKFADAKVSSVGEIRVGDTVRVLGQKNEDGTRVKPEEIVFGTFIRQAGTISDINAAAGTITIKDLATKKNVVVKTNSETVLKRLPEQMAQGLARIQQAKLAGGTGRGPGGDAPPAAGQGRGGFGGRGGPGGPGGGMRFDPARALESAPVITLADLKKGDAVMISSSSGADSASVTAITLVAGVEPLLTAAPTRNGQDPGAGSWGFDMPIPQ
jgi:hypothetical protein